MPRPRKLQRRTKLLTYEVVYEKIKNSKILTNNELIVLASMKRNAREVNERAIVKERKIMPTMEEVKEVYHQVAKKKTDAEIEKEEYSNRVISHILETCKLSKYDFGSVEQVQEAGKKYFILCEQNNIVPTSAGLSRALGLRRKELLAIVNGEKRVMYQEAYIDLWQLLEMYDEAMMKQGKVNAIVGIFNQKNNHGWVDKVEVVHGQDKAESDEEIKNRYAQEQNIIDLTDTETPQEETKED